MRLMKTPLMIDGVVWWDMLAFRMLRQGLWGEYIVRSSLVLMLCKEIINKCMGRFDVAVSIHLSVI